MKKLLVILVVFSTFLGGCILGGKKDEKQSFIDATVEATCLVFQSENIFDPALEGQAKDVYKKYGFDADNEEAMNTLTTKYENDADVQAAITKALEECAGDFAAGFEAVTEETTTPAVEVEPLPGETQPVDAAPVE